MYPFLIPCDLFLDCLVKKETVIGIIGKVQYQKIANKPYSKADKNVSQSTIFGFF